MLTVLLSGLAIGCAYAMVALGVNLAYLPSRIFNLAQPQIVVLGGFLGYAAIVQWHWSWPLALLTAAIIPALVAVVIEIVVMQLGGGARPGSHSSLVSTLGLGIALQAAMALIWGENPLNVPAIVPKGAVSIFGGSVLPAQILIICVAVAAATAYEVVAHGTKAGMRYLAVAEDSDAAAIRGISVRRTLIVSFLLAGMAGGICGLIVAPITFVYPELGSLLLLKGFVALAIGGFGSQSGALAGGIIVGVAEAFGGYYLGAQYPDIISFCLLFLVLLARPTGLFGARSLRTV
jgi:branched-chain amino acid transport system permease protein